MQGSSEVRRTEYALNIGCGLVYKYPEISIFQYIYCTQNVRLLYKYIDTH